VEGNYEWRAVGAIAVVDRPEPERELERELEPELEPEPELETELEPELEPEPEPERELEPGWTMKRHDAAYVAEFCNRAANRLLTTGRVSVAEIDTAARIMGIERERVHAYIEGVLCAEKDNFSNEWVIRAIENQEDGCETGQ
jgi:hypothetical protein